jgi:hypothetical protein
MAVAGVKIKESRGDPGDHPDAGDEKAGPRPGHDEKRRRPLSDRRR